MKKIAVFVVFLMIISTQTVHAQAETKKRIIPGEQAPPADRYGKDYAGLKGKNLSIKGPLAEKCPQFYKVYEVE